MVKIDHVAITVGNLEEAVNFYSKILGFQILKVKEKPELGVAYALLQAGQIALEIVSPLERKPSRQEPIQEGLGGVVAKLCGRVGLNHVSLRVENLEEACEELKGKGVNILAEFKPTGGGSKLAFFADPEGNLIELVEKP
ncbi:TPA: VOC family protein [Candidatus Bathyarchaeota archaeon]|nr:VOC family protein [Candidatus Bathyarchaeota archaeon]